MDCFTCRYLAVNYGILQLPFFSINTGFLAALPSFSLNLGDEPSLHSGEHTVLAWFIYLIYIS